MANNLAYASAYLMLLDKIYKKESATSAFEANPEAIKFSQENAKTIYLQELSIDGIADYSRASGYVESDVDLVWTAYTLATEWGVKLKLDAVDAENAMIQILQVAAELMRTKVIPQLDAYRFEKLCTTCGLDVSADLTYDTAIDAIDTAISTLDDAEVPQESRVLMISNEMHKLMKQSGEFYNVRISTQANNMNREITMFDNMPIVRVPKARFCNNFTFPTTTAGAFTKTSGSKDLNFVIADRKSVTAVVKNMNAKVIDPNLNSDGDFWVYGFRMFHDLFVPTNKVNGVYVHAKSTTN